MIGLGIGVSRLRRRGGADPLQALINDLYGNGEQGTFYVPKPLVMGAQKLWQDEQQLVPVTGDDQPVMRIDDLSPNSNNGIVFNETNSARPTYHTENGLHWLSFDGIDDNILNPNNHANPMCTIIGLQYISGRFVYGGRTGQDTRRYVDNDSDGNGIRINYGSNSTANVLSAWPSGLFVMSIVEDATTYRLRINGVEQGQQTKEGSIDTSTKSLISDFLNDNTPFGANAEMLMTGLIEINDAEANIDIATAEAYIAQLSGVTL